MHPPPHGQPSDIAQLLGDAEPALRRAFIPVVGADRAADAAAEAVAWGWEHREKLAAMENPRGYLYRVGRSKVRRRRRAILLPPPPTTDRLPVDPTLIDAMNALPDQQRSCVWLVHGCGWPHTDAATALGISPSSVSTHVGRGLDTLRRALTPERGTDNE